MSGSSDSFKLKVRRNDFDALLDDRRKNKKFTDVQLKVGDKLFDAHRVVLSLYSPVLEAAISEHWSTTNICTISDEYVDVDIVEDLLSFLYTGSIDLKPGNVQPVCMAAHFLQIPTLLEPSVKYLCGLINIDNVLSLFQFSTTCELECLNYTCLRFVNINYGKVFKSPEILEFPSENFKDLIVGLKKFCTYMLRVNTFHTIVRWTEKNPSERLNDLPILLENIPLEELQFEFLTETVSNHPLVKDSMPSIETVSAALANYRTYSRPWENQNLVVIDDSEEDDYTVKTRSMSCYDSETGEWRELPDMPSKRDVFAVAVINHQDIVVCGGFLEGEFCGKPKSVLMFEWSKQSWTELPEMPFGLGNPSLTTCRGLLYVNGNKEDTDFNLSAVLCYSFETQKWKSVAPMNEPRDARLVEYSDYLYAIGGESNDTGDETTTVEKYDPAADEWTMMASMPNSQINRSSTLHRNKIYVQVPSGFHVYDPKMDVWTSVSAPVKRISSSLVSMNDKLLIFNGPQSDIPEWVHEFDLSTQKFVEFAEWTPELDFCRAVVGVFK